MTTTRAAMTTASKAGHFPSTLTGADSARIEAALRAARSPQTRRAYASQWAAWGAWCASRGACPLPAAPVELAAYLAERAQSASTATVRLAKAAIVFVHKAKGEPSPITDDVIEVLRGLAASKATERGRGQAKAITRDDFAVILARAGEPRKLGRGKETAETAAERAQVDRAIAGVLFHAGLRRSEAAELRWGDVEPAASIPGALTIRVRTSKTNRDGEATDVRLAKNGAAAALTALRPANAAPDRACLQWVERPKQSDGASPPPPTLLGSKASPRTQAGSGLPANSRRPEPAPPRRCSRAAGRRPAWSRTTAQAHQPSAARLPSTFEGPPTHAPAPPRRCSRAAGLRAPRRRVGAH